MVKKNKKRDRKDPKKNKDSDNKNKNNSNGGGIKEIEKEKFIEFMALPYVLRKEEYGYKTQKDFAKDNEIHQGTLSEWKKEEEFWPKVREKMRGWAKDRTPNVIQGLYNKAVKEGNAQEAKFWMQYIEGWTEKSEVEHKSDVLDRLLNEIYYNADKSQIKPYSADPRRGTVPTGVSRKDKGQEVETE